MRVVFLDFDGVLNGFEHWPEGAPRRWLDPAAIARLNQITGAVQHGVIVITSTWRITRNCDAKALLEAAGATAPIIGVTPRLPGEPRGHEIAMWLHEHAVDGFVILDDDSDMGNLDQWLVKTSWSAGLLDEHVGPAIERLSR